MQELYVTAQPIDAKPPRKSKMFPLLVFLLFAAYGIMTMVVSEQGTVIQSQRYLIQQLMTDSQQLTSLKMKENARRSLEQKMADKMAQSRPDAATPHADSNVRNCKNCKVPDRKPNMEKQPLQAADRADKRRLPVKL